MNRTNICKNIVQSIKDYITDQVKLEPHRVEKHFVRRRKLSLLQVIIYLFFSSKASMFQNLSQIREELGTLSFPDVSKQALSKARQFINPSLFKELYYLSVDLFYSQISSRKLWQGYHLFAVDGSRIELPNSKSTFDFFGEMSSYPDPNRRYTMGLASIIYDVLDDYILHASIHKFLSSERAAALEHLKVLEDMGLYNNSIIIFDRGYYSEDMFRYCVEHGHLCVMRLKEGINLSKKCNGDMISILQGTSKEGTSDVPIRNLFNISHLQPSLLLLVLEIYQHQNKDFEESVQDQCILLPVQHSAYTSPSLPSSRYPTLSLPCNAPKNTVQQSESHDYQNEILYNFSHC